MALTPLTVCHPVNMFRASSCCVHRLCMLCEDCVVTAWWTPHYGLFSSRLLLLNFFMLPVHGMVSAHQPTEIIPRQSSAEKSPLTLCSMDQPSVKKLIDDADDSVDVQSAHEQCESCTTSADPSLMQHLLWLAILTQWSFNYTET